jgi:inhibitor of cysteine peptidase
MVRRHGPARALAWSALLVAAMAMTPESATAQAIDETVQLAPGGQAMIDLAENPSTGYVWRFDAMRSKNAAIVRVADQGFSRPPSDSPPIGAPGRHRWSLEGVSAGRAELMFVYQRPWEDRPAREHTVAVEVH